MLDLDAAERSIRAPFLSSHLLFADDLLVFFPFNRHSVGNLDRLFDLLGNFVGLRINKAKSMLFYSRGCNDTLVWSHFVNVPIGRFLSDTLVCLCRLYTIYPKVRNFFPLVDMCRKAMEG